METDLITKHKRRIARAGPKLWNFLKNLKPHDILSGQEGLLIMNAYGIRPEDVVFFLDVLGVGIKVLEFEKLVIEQNVRIKQAVPKNQS